MSITKKNRFRSRYNLVFGIILAIFTIVAFNKIRTQSLTIQERLDSQQNQINNLEKKINKITSRRAFYEKNSELIDPELVKAIIAVESSGNPNAYNTATGAVGLMQITPVVYKKVCGLTKTEAFEPEKNIGCASLFLSHLLNRYGGNLEKALLFYNNGYVVRNKKYYKKVINELTMLEDNSNINVN